MDYTVGINYMVEYHFISKLINNTERHDLFDITVLNRPFGLRVAFFLEEGLFDETFDWDNFSVTKFKSKNLTYWLLKFPPCRGPIDAVYGLVVKYRKKRVVYFTLESSPSGRYVLGMPSVEGHRNLGTVDELLTEEEFKDWALRELKENPKLFEKLKSDPDPIPNDGFKIIF